MKRMLFVILVICVTTIPVWAEDGDNILGIEPAYIYEQGAHGTAASLFYMHGIGDFIRLGGGLNWDYMFGPARSDVALRVNTDVLIDAFEWVPYLRFSAGMRFPGGQASIQPELSAGAGLDWHPWPDYSIGALAEVIFTGRRLGTLQDLIGFVFCFYF